MEGAPEEPADPARRESGPTIAGRYVCRGVIGRGGMGLVYLARDRVEDREVVVKVLAPAWQRDAEAIARFEREAERLSHVRHVNIVEMFDHGRDGDTAYLVMEYLRGELLADYIKRHSALSIAQFVPIAAQVLKGIGYAHARDIMVRDIKPANVMLCSRGGRGNFVKILDFGLARLLRNDREITQEHVMGTVGYLSPEQIENKPLDLRVDVYALGVMFYSMLSGRMPFRGDSDATVFHQTLSARPPDLREMCPEGTVLPDGLVQLVHDCLEKDPDKRPTDANAIVERLIDAVPAALFRLPREGAEDSSTGSSQSSILIRPASRSEEPAAASASSLPSASRHEDDGSASERAFAPEAGHSTTSSYPAPAPRNNLWVLVAGLVVGVAVVATVFWPDAPIEAPPSDPAPSSSALTDEELLVLVNQDDPGLALDYPRRRAALTRLEASGVADRVDRELQLRLDLQQAAAAPDSCAVFQAAVEGLRGRLRAADRTWLGSVVPPSDCADIEPQALLQTLAAAAE